MSITHKSELEGKIKSYLQNAELNAEKISELRKVYRDLKEKHPIVVANSNASISSNQRSAAFENLPIFDTIDKVQEENEHLIDHLAKSIQELEETNNGEMSEYSEMGSEQLEELNTVTAEIDRMEEHLRMSGIALETDEEIIAQELVECQKKKMSLAELKLLELIDPGVNHYYEDPGFLERSQGINIMDRATTDEFLKMPEEQRLGERPPLAESIAKLHSRIFNTEHSRQQEDEDRIAKESEKDTSVRKELELQMLKQIIKTGIQQCPDIEVVTDSPNPLVMAETVQDLQLSKISNRSPSFDPAEKKFRAAGVNDIIAGKLKNLEESTAGMNRTTELRYQREEIKHNQQIMQQKLQEEQTRLQRLAVLEGVK